MELNYLLFAGYIIGLGYSIANKEYSMNWNDPEGKKNIMKSIVSLFFVIVLWYYSFMIKADDNINTATLEGIGVFITFIIFYVGIGAMPEFFFHAITTLNKQYINKKIEETKT